MADKLKAGETSRHDCDDCGEFEVTLEPKAKAAEGATAARRKRAEAEAAAFKARAVAYCPFCGDAVATED